MGFLSSFVGGFYQARSATVAADEAVNIYTETRQAEGSPKQTTIYGTPGLLLDAAVNESGCRGWFTQDGRTWVVVGDTLYERLMAGVYSAIASIPNDGGACYFTTNGQGGNQLGVSGGGSITVVNLVSGVVTVPVLPFSGPVMLAFLDTYALCNQADSPIVWFSGLDDLTSWDALDFFTRSNTSDNVVGIGVSRERVWVFGSKTSTQFYDSGDTDTPFVPYPGTTMQVGLVSAALLALYSDTWFWVAETSKGQRRVVTATEPSAQTISTPPIDAILSACSTLDDAYSLVYEQDGHLNFCVTMPSSPEDIKTICFDATEKQWHRRAGWSPTLGVYTQWRARGCTAVDGAILVGDYDTGDLYELNLDTYTDNTVTIRRERTAPYLANENQWLFLDQVELGMQAGVGLSTGQGSAPVATLEISRDNAQTWVNAGNASLGAIGRYLDRCIWRRLGRARSDRLVLRVTMTDPVKCVWQGVWLRTTPGSGQL